MKATLEGRCVGILISDGSDGAKLKALRASIEAAGASVKVIAPKAFAVELKGGKVIAADGQLAGTPSVVVDAIALILSADATNQLLSDSAAIQFVMDAYGHLKAIGHNPEAAPLLRKAGVAVDEGVTGLGEDFIRAAKQRHFDREPKLRSLA